MSFALHLPKLTFSGDGAIKDAMVELGNKTVKKMLIVTERALIDLGLLQDVFAGLDALSIDYILFDDITANPTTNLVRKGIELYKNSECDGFIAIGGGSSIDCAKAIRLVIANGGDICDYSGMNATKRDGDVFVAINTTAGTSAEMTSNSVITDEDHQVKMVIIDAKQIPDIAVNDPSLMLDLPADITAATGMDALTHAIESYVTPNAYILTKPTALEAIRLITQFLPVAVQDGKNIEARENMACAQFLAGMAFNSAGLGAVHALAHQPGATHNLAHGVCNAILLPIVSQFNAEINPKPFKDIAKAMGGNTEGLSDEKSAELCINLIENLSIKLGIPSGLSEFDVNESDIDKWIDNALLDPCMPSNPRVLSAVDIKLLYSLAM